MVDDFGFGITVSNNIVETMSFKAGGQINVLQKRRDSLVAYLGMKIEAEDWHGVADAAMDLREIDAELSVYRSLVNA